MNSTNRNETEVAINRPDLFLRVNKAEQHGLGRWPGLFEENLGNELEKKTPFFLPDYAKSLCNAVRELGSGSW